MDETSHIKVVNANVHNLKGISIAIPKNSLTTITGPSGSGKSSLAFDTIYIEGQRRYIESLSSYARQFLGQFSPPDVESITGLSPSIAITQKTTTTNPRSTVGTVTEIYDYMRVLFARVGTLYCLKAGDEVKKYTVPKIVKEICTRNKKTKIMILSPLKFKTKKELAARFESYLSLGFSRCRVDGEILLLDNTKTKISISSAVEVVVDRVVLKDGIEKRLSDSLEYALKIGNGNVAVVADEEELFFSEKNISRKSKKIYPDLEPRLFSFNSPLGVCKRCNGIGQSKSFDPKKIIEDETLSIPDGAVKILNGRNSFLFKMAKDMAKHEGVNIALPLKKLPKKFLRALFEGTTKKYKYSFVSETSHFDFSKKFPGLINWLEKKYRETTSDRVRSSLEDCMEIKKCPDCQGLRLNPVALGTKVADKNIMDICNLSIQDALGYFKKVGLDGEKRVIAKKLIKEIDNRLQFLVDVGLGYLSLNRPASTLSGGEAQRIRLATQIGSQLSGILYVLDEPSIGLHQRDNIKLIKTLKSLRDIGNTVVVVEHDEKTIKESDYIVDIGPGAGTGGGRVVAKGNLAEIMKSKTSVTADYLSRRRENAVPEHRRKTRNFIELRGATKNNIDNIDVKIPLEVMVCVCGVSGSGKSTLVHDILVPAVRAKLVRGRDTTLFSQKLYREVKGASSIESLVQLDQTPIGRTPHSNPATYTGLFDLIRTLFSRTPESQVRGYKPGRFSFNVKGGRCDECEGNGVKKIEMHFLPDVYITCDECHGSRYNQETLSILYKGKSIADVLSMGVEQAGGFFKNHTKIHKILRTLLSVGLGYMTLGQAATTLSGGEAQRLKLSRELAKSKRGHCLYVLDEPTTGLHFEDINVLLKALNQLIGQGNTVVVIEHNLDVIKTADYIIDLGPEGGDGGGRVVGCGTPEDVAKVAGSYTGKFLKTILSRNKR